MIRSDATPRLRSRPRPGPRSRSCPSSIGRLVLLAVLLLAAAPAGSLLSTARASGLLVPDRAGAAPLRIEDHLVDVEIASGIAVTTLVQTFRNDSDRDLEATYIFPIPEGADITDFRMTFDGKLVQGEVLPADEARAIYESIVRRNRDPGLIEFVGRRLLRARIFPIEARSTTEIRVEYQQVLDTTSGMMRYHYPLRTPGASSVAHGTTRFSVDLEATVDAVVPPRHVLNDLRRSGLREFSVCRFASDRGHRAQVTIAEHTDQKRENDDHRRQPVLLPILPEVGEEVFDVALLEMILLFLAVHVAFRSVYRGIRGVQTVAEQCSCAADGEQRRQESRSPPSLPCDRRRSRYFTKSPSPAKR